jgi:hypothetical protein
MLLAKTLKNFSPHSLRTFRKSVPKRAALVIRHQSRIYGAWLGSVCTELWCGPLTLLIQEMDPKSAIVVIAKP